MPKRTRREDPSSQDARGAEDIPMAYTAANLRRLVAEAAESRSPFSEHQVAEWAFRYWFNCVELSARADPVRCSQSAVEVAQEIDGQWEVELANAVLANPRKQFDYSSSTLLKDLWSGWLARLDAAGV